MNRTLLRLGAAAFLADMALYLVMIGVPYRALELGAAAVLLGLLPAARALPYSLIAVWAGARTEGADRLRIARITVSIGALAALAFIAAPGLVWLFLLLGVLGVAFAFYWPSLQATLADLGRAGAAGHLGWFNIAWSAGKATGFLVGGWLLAGLGFPVLFAAAGLAMIAVVALIARPASTGTDRGRGVGGSPGPEEARTGSAPSAPPVPRPGTRAFRLAAWTANAVAYGLATLLNIHYPAWLREIGHGEALLGTYLGVVFFTQTGSFLWLTRFPGWRYRVAPLLLWQVPLVLVVALLPWFRAPWLILAGAPAVGAGLGMAYFASLFYSVEHPEDRGRNAGLHEAILGVGSMVIPVLGGWVAGMTGRLEAPYLVGAAVGGVGLGTQAWLLRRQRGG